MSSNNSSDVLPPSSFQRAIDRFTDSLAPNQRREFAACTLEDVTKEVVTMQERRGNQKTMRGMARLQGFLEAMRQYGEVMNALLNTTPFLGYIWVS